MSRLSEEITMTLGYLIGIPLFIVYARIIYVLIRHYKRFNSVFFRLVVFCGCVDCMQYLLSNYVQRLPRFGGLFAGYYKQMDTPNKLHCVPLLLANHLQLASILGSFVLAFNRFTTVALMSNRWEQRWSILFPYIVAILIILPLIFLVNMLFSECSYSMEIRHSTFYYKIDVKQSINLINFRIAMIICGLVVALPTFFLNILTFRRLAQHNRTQGTKREVREQYQFNLTIMTFSRFTADMIFVAYSCTTYLLANIAADNSIRNVHFYFYTMNDLISLTPGLILFIGSKRVKEAFLGRRIWKMYSSKSTSAVLVVS